MLLGLRGAVPIVQHLRGEDEVQGETGKESVQNELVVDFLEGGKNTRQRAGKVVEDLLSISAHFFMFGRNPQSYRESTELTGSSFLPDGQDLGNLASHAQSTGACLEVRHGLGVDDRSVTQ